MHLAALVLLLFRVTLPQPVVSGNFPRDLYGPADNRNQTWGHADSDTLDITFSPPPGC